MATVCRSSPLDGFVLDVDVRLGAAGAGPAVYRQGRQAVVRRLHGQQRSRALQRAWHGPNFPKHLPQPQAVGFSSGYARARLSSVVCTSS